MVQVKTMATTSKPITTTGTPKRPRKKQLTPEARYLDVQKEAYYLAEKDGFRKNSVEYWVEAEAGTGA